MTINTDNPDWLSVLAQRQKGAGSKAVADCYNKLVKRYVARGYAENIKTIAAQTERPT